MINPELKPFLEMWQREWSRLTPNASAPARRTLLERLSTEARKPLPAGVVDEERFVDRPGRSVRVRVFRDKTARSAPCLVYMHGGGWMQGSPETHDAITIGIVEQTGYTVISVDYALAPEEPFPAAVQDCEAVIRWAFDNATELRLDRKAIGVGGDSAGANLAAVMALVFRGAAQQLIGQVLFYPAVDNDLSRASYVENADGPIITTASMAPTLAQYCPDPVARNSPLVTPLKAESHAGLPPAFIAVAEHDPLRDEGIAYAERLAASGVPMHLDRGVGLIHGYLRAMPYSASSRAGLAAACEWLRRLAGTERSSAVA